MALNPQYMLAPSLEQYFVDKDTGLPLNGTVTFYVDTSRTTPKDVYILSGSPPNYTYTNIGNVVNISGGVLTYLNTNIQIYYFPFASADPNAAVELYYAVIENSNGVTQFTREGWPNFTEATMTEEDATNFIPNGQFLLHSDLPAIPPYQAGEIRSSTGITNVAYGGWTFERPSGSSSKDFVIFRRNNSYIANPTSNPRYDINVICESAGSGDAFKDLRLKYNDVNKFASTSTQYTFYFEGISNSGTPSVDLVLIKNFGAGGSATTEVTLATFSLTGAMAPYKAVFTFGANVNKTIGAQNDDYLQLALRFATDNQFDINLTDVALVQNAVDVVLFPVATNSQFTYRSLAGFMPIPAYDGSDLYLPIQLTAQGFQFDSSEIGDVIAETSVTNYTNSLSTVTNRLLADGVQYETTEYSLLGIPFSRLQAKYWDVDLNLPVYGTGAQYFTGIFSGSGNELRISNNSPGAVTNTADGAAATGFTFTTIHTGADYAVKAYMVAASEFYIENIIPVAATPINAHTSGFTVATVQPGTLVIPQISSVITTVAASLAGEYFTFSTNVTNFYVWFKVDGGGSDPAPGGTGILVMLNSTDSAAVVAQKIRESLNGWQITTILTTVASAITAAAYFTVNSTAQAYYVWYTKDGAGTDPAVGGKIGIKVAVLSTDTNTQVATKTQIAINQKYFAVPDLRGIFLRGWNNGSGNDPDAATRWSLVPGVIGDMLGTSQESAVKSHFHTLNFDPADLSGGSQGSIQDGSANTSTNSTGGYESRPLNTYVNYVIKY